jgi:hypothetical protein
MLVHVKKAKEKRIKESKARREIEKEKKDILD